MIILAPRFLRDDAADIDITLIDAAYYYADTPLIAPCHC